MKIYNVKTKNKQDEIDDIIMKMSQTEVDYITNLYSKISMVEYTDEFGFECMFAILDDYYLSKIKDCYNSYSLIFEIFDITKDVVFDENIKIRYKNYLGRSQQLEITSLFKKYKKDWITKDDILDKILEKGIDSLTDFDLDVLNS
jgi:hypothetical protein